MAQEKDPRKTSPHHGSELGSSPDQHPQQHQSVSQADGTAANAPRGETDAGLRSQTPEGRDGKLHPSAPNDANSMPANTTRDSAGEVGDPTGRGTLDAPKESTDTGTEIADDKKSTEKTLVAQGTGDVPRKDEQPSQEKEGEEAA